jgi:hypothetical protein
MNIARVIVWLGILVCTMAFWIMVGMYLAKQFK